MAPHLVRAQSAYKDIRICSFQHTHTDTHTDNTDTHTDNTHTHTSLLFFSFIHCFAAELPAASKSIMGVLPCLFGRYRLDPRLKSRTVARCPSLAAIWRGVFPHLSCCRQIKRTRAFAVWDILLTCVELMGDKRHGNAEVVN